MVIHHKALHVGTPSRSFNEEDWEITPVYFHGFKGLDSTRGEYFTSPEFMCFGHKWSLKVYPGSGMNSKPGMIAVYLRNLSKESIQVYFGFSVMNSAGKDVAVCVKDGCSKRLFHNSSNSWVYDNVAKCEDIMGALINGALVIHVRIRQADSSPFIPGNPFGDMMLKMFLDEPSADVMFEFEDEDEQGRKTRIHAHRLILQQCAPDLAALCGSGEGLTSVPITKVDPAVFRHMLYYVYGGKVAEDDLKVCAKDMIDAADRFGIVNLKLEAEARYAKSTILSIDNVMECLLHADAKNCALMKEAVMDFILENRTVILEKVPLKDVPGGLFADLLTAMMRKDSDGEGGDDLNAMRIGNLRKKLHEKGLDIDGSRETMIASIKENA